MSSRVRVPINTRGRPTPTVGYLEAERTITFILAQRASVGSTEASETVPARVAMLCTARLKRLAAVFCLITQQPRKDRPQ
jgi:hypothetical protein